MGLLNIGLRIELARHTYVRMEYKLLAGIFTHIVINIPAISSEMYVDKSTVGSDHAFEPQVNPPRGNRRTVPKKLQGLGGPLVREGCEHCNVS
jgi:hypothetical protein